MHLRQRLADRAAMPGFGMGDGEAVQKGHDGRRPAGERNEQAPVAIGDRLRARQAVRR
jgi:hypothetical protein